MSDMYHMSLLSFRRLASVLVVLMLVFGVESVGAEEGAGEGHEPQSASDVLCDGLEGERAKACALVCKVQPAKPVCLVFLRFGKPGVMAAQAIQRDPSVAAKKLRAKTGIATRNVESLRHYLEGSGMAPPEMRSVDERKKIALARSFHQKGAVAYQVARYDAAEKYFRKAVAIFVQVGHPNVAVSVNNLGGVHQARGEYDKALEFYGKGLTIRKKVYGKLHPSVAMSLNNIGRVHAELGDDAAALEHFKKALSISKKLRGGEHSEVALVLNNIGMVHKRRADFARALEYLKQALAIRRKVYGDHHLEVAESWSNVGLAYKENGNYTKAVGPYRKALAIWMKQRGADHPDVAIAYNNIGMLHYARGEYEKALGYLRKAMAIRLKVYGESHPQVVTSLNNIGMVYVAYGRHDYALGQYRKALAVAKKVYGESHPRVATILSNIGGALYAGGQYEEALEHHQEALEMRKKLLGNEHPSVARTLASLGVVLAARAQAPKAAEKLQAALAIYHGHFLSNVEAATSDMGIRDSLAVNRRYLDVLLSLTVKSPNTAFAAALRWHGLATRAEQVWRDRQRLFRQAAASERKMLEAHRELQQERLRLVSGYAESEQSRAKRKKRLATLDEQLSKKRSSLEKKMPAVAAQRKVLVADSDDVCATLRKTKRVLVHFVSYERYTPKVDEKRRWVPSYAVFTIAPRKKSCAFARHDVAAKKVDKAVDAYRNKVRLAEKYYGEQGKKKAYARATAAMDAAGKKLRKLVWDPVAKALGTQDDVLIVPDGRLLEISFGALPRDDDTYLVEHLKMSYLPYPAAVLQTTPKGKKAKGAFVAGDINYRSSFTDVRAATKQWRHCGDDCKAVGQKQAHLYAKTVGDIAMGKACGYSGNWPTLPPTEAKTVAEKLAEVSGGSTLLVTGTSAHEQAVRAALPGRRIIHFATHGFYSPAKQCAPRETPGEQRAILFDDRGAGANIDPLRLSALVLSGANAKKRDRESDGVLTARDIVSLDLRGTELVTLAACETGRGDQTLGEGSLGLARAFLVAGAKTAVVSQWQVPGKRTVAMFDTFYDLALKKGDDEDKGNQLDAAEALRKAQIEQIEKRREAGHKHSAFEWGAFVPVSNGL